MSAEPPPSGGNSGFNPDDWTNANDPIDNQFLAANYLQFPLAQGAQTLANTTVSGVLTVQNDSTFADLATFNNGIDITTTAGITFSDTTVQTTAFIEANYAQLNTDNIFLTPYKNTFQGTVNINNLLEFGNQIFTKFQQTNSVFSIDNNYSYSFSAPPAINFTVFNPSNVKSGLSINSFGITATLPLNMSNLSITNIGQDSTAYTQLSGTSNTSIATTEFVQNAVQVSGVQVGDSPLLWTGANTNQYNAGTVATLAYTYPYGLSQLYNISGGAEEFSLVANNGVAGSQDNAFRIYCIQGNKTGTQIAASIPQLILSNNGTPMQVKDGINIPTGEIYAINGVDILAPYSTTTQMNSAISTALIPYSNTVQMNSAISTATSGLAPINSPTFTGLPLLTTTPTAGISNAQAIANLQYITNQGFTNTTTVNNLITSALTPYATTSYVNGTFAPAVSPAFAGIPITPTWTTGNDVLQIANVQYIQGLISTLAQTYPPNALTALTGGLATNWIVIAPIPTFLTGTIQGTTVYLNDCTFTARINYQGQGNLSNAYWNLGRNLATTVSAFNMTGSIVNLTLLDTYPMYLTYFPSNQYSMANLEMQNTDIPNSFWNTGGNYQITFSGAFSFT